MGLLVLALIGAFLLLVGLFFAGMAAVFFVAGTKVSAEVTSLQTRDMGGEIFAYPEFEVISGPHAGMRLTGSFGAVPGLYRNGSVVRARLMPGLSKIMGLRDITVSFAIGLVAVLVGAVMTRNAGLGLQ
jgi:hypothetical protein